MNENYYGQIGDILCEAHNRKRIISIVFHIWITNGDLKKSLQYFLKHFSFFFSFFFYKDQMLKFGPVLQLFTFAAFKNQTKNQFKISRENQKYFLIF